MFSETYFFLSPTIHVKAGWLCFQTGKCNIRLPGSIVICQAKARVTLYFEVQVLSLR